ncbi:hypothetical protein C8T65DRAFT_635397 [Cerioporus squamosus]|nr:hypothetical protein C8T65DRAFT_635397 [Cerioporus squamosus]
MAFRIERVRLHYYLPDTDRQDPDQLPIMPAAALSTTTSTTVPSTATVTTKGPEVLAYRFNGQSVYVTPAESYEQAIDFAQSVYPALGDIARERISICVNGHIGKNPGHIRIAPMAWKIVVAKLTSFEILDIVVLPAAHKRKDPSAADQTVDVEDSMSHDEPPKYEEKRICDRELGSKSESPAEGRLKSSTSTSSMSAWAKTLFGKRADRV